MTADYRFDDFTEKGYREALALARVHWAFESFGTERREPHALWRHDIDVSPNRALRLAQIEHEGGLKATYFFLLHCEFYNCMEARKNPGKFSYASYGVGSQPQLEIGRASCRERV